MKTLADESLSALMSIDDRAVVVGNNGGIGRGLYELDEDDSGGCGWGEKKRRLSVEQVKALEKSFEVENKLEPDRKVKLAQDLGLQPRQVAVWFQNRRARWKTKQLERDYGVLKANYDDLQSKYEALHRENEELLKEMKELKAKLKIEREEDEYDEYNEPSVKEESRYASDFTVSPPFVGSEPSLDLNFEGVHGSIPPSASVFKEGSSDSDSSAILNDAGDCAAATSLFHDHHDFMTAEPSMIEFSGGEAENSLNFMSFVSESDEKESTTAQKIYQPQLVKVEEYNFFSGEEACNLFSDEQAPTLHWYCPSDQWN